MDVVIILALSGLFLFLALRHQQSSFSKQRDAIYQQIQVDRIEIERRLAVSDEHEAKYNQLLEDLNQARQANSNVVSLDLHRQLVQEQRELVLNSNQELFHVTQELEKSNGKQISERVRLGQVTESILPFLSTFPHDAKRVRFLGQPIDMVVFNDDEVVFVEVKTGDAKLTEKQRHIKKLIDGGKVRFEIHKVTAKGHEIQ